MAPQHVAPLSPSPPDSHPLVLVLGAGMSTRPLVHQLSKHAYNVVVISRTLAKAAELVDGAARATVHPQAIDVTTEHGLASVADLIDALRPAAVCSMLPPPLHPRVARICVDRSTHFCTASYVSPEMRALHGEAVDRGVTLLNECGVDPGTDHMSAMRVIDEARANGGQVRSFTSLCGGLPAPQADTNPWHYKLSWAPRGVLMLAHRRAQFLENGTVVDRAGRDIFAAAASTPPQDFGGDVGKLEFHPNGDSLPFAGQYGLDVAKLDHFMRGSFRYPGWCRMQLTLLDLGLLSLDERDDIANVAWSTLLNRVVFDGAVDETSGDALAVRVADRLGVAVDADAVQRLAWLGMFDGDRQTAATARTPLDALCALCEERLQYEGGEADMIAMRHNYVIDYPEADPPRRDHVSTTLVELGETTANGDTAMARTVSIPLSIAVRAVVDGHFTGRGVQTPIVPELYHRILGELDRDHGITFDDKVDRSEPL